MRSFRCAMFVIRLRSEESWRNWLNLKGIVWICMWLSESEWSWENVWKSPVCECEWGRQWVWVNTMRCVQQGNQSMALPTKLLYSFGGACWDHLGINFCDLLWLNLCNSDNRVVQWTKELTKHVWDRRGQNVIPAKLCCDTVPHAAIPFCQTQSFFPVHAH